MKRSSLLLLFPALACAQWAGSGSVNGVPFTYEAKLEPAMPGIQKTCGGLLTTGKVAKRHFCDFASNRYFGYDFTLEPMSDSRYQLQISALSMPPQQMTQLFPNPAGWAPYARPAKGNTEVVRSGDTIAMDLFINPVTGQKIVDYITIGPGRTAPRLVLAMEGGNVVTLPAGKVCVIEFLLTSCNHCGQSADMMAKLQTEYGSRNLQFYGASIGPRTPDAIPNFVRDHKLQFPVGAVDVENVRGFLNMKAMTRMLVPVVVVVDRNGVIRYQSDPEKAGVEEGKLRTAIEASLK